MQKFLASFKQLDIFGVPVTVLTDKADEKFKSLLGGTISIVVALLSILYFCYIINLWSSGSILPSITLNQQAIQYQKFSWETPLIEVISSDPTSKIDPFSQANNIITPILYTLVNEDTFQSPQVLFSDPNLPSSVMIKDGSLILNNNLSDNVSKDDQSRIYFLTFVKCNEKFMTNDSYCASQETIDEYLSSFHGFMAINVNIQQFNYEKNEFETITKSVFQAFSPEFSQFSSINIKIQDTIVDDGILFENIKYSTSINNFEIINQVIGTNYVSNILSWYSGNKYPIESIMGFQISLDNIKIVNQITMPKLNSVLAQIGSIVQLIFMLKYIAIYINTTLLNEKMFHQIVCMYYPNLKMVSIKHNLLGKPVLAEYENKSFTIRSQFLKQYQHLIDFAQQKIRLNNIIYEISRIQFLLSQLHGIERLTDSHNLGSELKLGQDAVLEFSNRVSIVPEDASETEDYNVAIRLLTKQLET